MKHITLQNNQPMPILGFGTWQIKDDACTEAVQTALSVGYRHIDTADGYHNHAAVGAGIKASGVPREDIFLTSKIWMDDFAHDDALSAVDTFLEELDTPYLDLVLMHWPDRLVPYSETLKALEIKQAEGKIKAIGVANFTEQHLKDVAAAGHQVMVNQIELHPTWQQKDLVNYCQNNDIAVTAYSPLGRGEALELPLITELAEKYQATPAQIILAWFIAKDIIAIPKSSNAERIAENFGALELAIAPEDIAKIDAIEQKDRIINPDFADFDY